MKNKLILIALIIVLMGCYDVNVEHKSTDYVIREGENPLSIVIIDNCEYLIGGHGCSTVLMHKGNCNNPIHAHNGGQHE